jgi:hypothetical protein
VSVRRATGIVLAALAASLLSACGSNSSSSTTPTAKVNVDTPKVAKSIENTVLEKRHLHVKVLCPALVPAVVHQTFECVATARSSKPPFTESKTPFVVTIQNARGYVTYEGK